MKISKKSLFVGSFFVKMNIGIIVGLPYNEAVGVYIYVEIWKKSSPRICVLVSNSCL